MKWKFALPWEQDWADILRQLLAEALVLAVAGGALGLFLAGTVLRGLPLLLKQSVDSVSIDTRALAFAAIVCLFVTVLCCLAPGLQRRRHRHPFRLRQSLVVGQIALSLVLLLSAGAFLRVFVKLVNRDTGFDSAQVYYFGIGLPEGRYNDRQTVDFHEKLRARLAEIPGVEAAGIAGRLPLGGRDLTTTFQFENAGLPPSEWSAVVLNLVDPAYFSALHIPLLTGRTFSWDTDRPEHPAVLMVNRAFEKAYGGIVGRRLQLRFRVDFTPPNQLWEVVGVVADTYQKGLDQAIRPQIYLPVSQTGLDGGSYVVRTSRADAGLPTAIAAAVRSIDPDLERINVRRLDSWVHDSLGDRRSPAILTGLSPSSALR